MHDPDQNFSQNIIGIQNLQMHKGQWLYKAIADVGQDCYGAILWERNDQSALVETTGKIFGGERSFYRNI